MGKRSTRQRQGARPSGGAKRLVWVVGLVFVLGVFLYGLLATGLLESGRVAAEPAPDFTVTTVDGASFTLSAYRGKAVVLDFIIANCPSCAVEIPALARVYEEYQSRGLEVLVLDVSPYETAADLLGAKQRFGGGDHRWAIDEGQAVTLAYRVRALGTTIIIDREGRIAYRDEGATGYETLRRQVARLR